MRPATTALMFAVLALVQAAPATEAPALSADWAAIAHGARAVALKADRGDQPDAVAAMRAYRWARLFAKTEGEAYRDWITALRERGGGAQLARGDYRVGDRTLGAILSPALAQRWSADPGRGDVFFSTVTPTDNLVRVLEILAAIERRAPDDLERYFNLALAIAVVHDTAPRTDWPHAQVSEQQCPRRWPDPADAFAFWVGESRGGRLVFPLEYLSVAQLTHVVDTSASFEELRWAQRFLPVGELPTRIEELLNRVPLTERRIAAGEFQWPWPDYRLQTIWTAGGICADRAYFAAQVLKSRAIPSALLCGTGRHGRHAWVGYQIDLAGRWRFDCGKEDAAEVFNTVAIDPQSWREIDEWEMRRWGSPLNDERRRHAAALQAEFAPLWLAEGEPELALRAGYRAVGQDVLEERWWSQLLEICAAVRPGDSRESETILREAIAVAWPDPAVEARFVRQLARSLEVRGEPLAAATEWDRFAARLDRRRVDQRLDGSRERVSAEIDYGRIATARPMARRVIAEQGREAGVALLDRFVFPLVRQLRAAGQMQEAELLLAETRGSVGARLPAVQRELARLGAN